MLLCYIWSWVLATSWTKLGLYTVEFSITGHQLPNRECLSLYQHRGPTTDWLNTVLVYMGVWSRNLRPCTWWSLGIHVCARVVFAYFKDRVCIYHLELMCAHMWVHFFSACGPYIGTTCARNNSIDLHWIASIYIAPLRIEIPRIYLVLTIRISFGRNGF